MGFSARSSIQEMPVALSVRHLYSQFGAAAMPR
jgi:hypothetical protein